MIFQLTYYAYLARQTPKELLCQYVRQAWVPQGYSASMALMYEWTPDECIPEFYTDPSIFRSIHDDLPDLAVPPWAASPAAFVDLHMQALESDAVSRQLHLWIDITFGFRLTGAPAVESKNVFLGLLPSHACLRTHNVVQLFGQPHPPRFAESVTASSPVTAATAPSSHVSGSMTPDFKGHRATTRRPPSTPSTPSVFSTATASFANTQELTPPLQALCLLEDTNSFLSREDHLPTTDYYGYSRVVLPTLEARRAADMVALGNMIGQMFLHNHLRYVKLGV